MIKESGDREFPPRLPEQPIFYPVLNQEYAAQPVTGMRQVLTQDTSAM
ncbi:hypothetical protein LC607_10285 [Nostoc sp. CHAB 5824]|nr:hypothetical protein [Nostoc sp. CHAB 5824]